MSLEYRVDLPSERCNRWIEAFIVREDLPICCLRKHADILLLRFNLGDSKLRVRMICYHLAIGCKPAVARFTMHAWFNLGVCNNVRCVQRERANFTVLVLGCIEADFSYMSHFAAFSTWVVFSRLFTWDSNVFSVSNSIFKCYSFIRMFAF